MSEEHFKERILELCPKLRETFSVFKLDKNKRLEPLLASPAIKLVDLNYYGVIVVSNDMELNEIYCHYFRELSASTK